ncbi:protein draper isoform X5 [Prorops nasuta]|uniref:protein draper isoform X5 n=1 Tax=Prorops nasuta TaxID=863751 RepID=UPI0034CDCEDA
MASTMIWLVALLTTFVGTVYALEGPNICTRQETYKVTVKISEQKPYSVREQVWCWSFPPKCTNYKVVYKTIYREEELVKQRPVEECCKGYTRTNNGDRCIPVCSEDCRHGTCVAPDVCKCELGYGGPHCDYRCELGKWGVNCTQDCLCQNDAVCDPFDGKCMCTRGWSGKYCEKTCPPDRFGQNCGEECRCKNGGSCHHISGECHCAPGYTGPLCDDLCPAGKHGDECKSECRCQNGGSCNPENGKCYCTPGWMGSVCANRCPEGFWGKNCSMICECSNGGGCHHIKGDCQCKPGYFGDKCLKICPQGTYGVNCTNKCNCENGATCSNVNGNCKCSEGWTGQTCDTRACPDGLFGSNCTKVCQCDNEKTDLCHPWTGQCKCKAGWDGETCSRPCPFYTYGKGCLNRCNCKNNAQCSPFNGTCICAAGYRGNMTCDHVTGEYICRPGYLGITCEHPCPPNRYGLNCANHCHCKNGAECHHVTGECQCRPGWKGEHCQTPCPEGTYGVNCTQHCKCQNGGDCRPNDGHCRCAAGWIGTQCTEICPEGYFGDHCMKPCECKNDEFFICHPADGCICRHGYAGPNCDEQLFSRNVQEKEEAGYGSVVAGIFAAIIVIAMTLAGWFYHRRRVADLKKEMAQVHYIAEPVTPVDRNQFDNPVYSYQGSSKSDDGTATLLNNIQIRNDLGTNKNINTERAKLGLGQGTDDEDDLKGACSLQFSLKNKDADMGNPNLNVYHSIDDMDGKRIEHVYDEIKQNKGNDVEYDHLDYTRPLSTWKPHYQRMANGFGFKAKDLDGASSSGASSSGHSSRFSEKDPETGGT